VLVGVLVGLFVAVGVAVAALTVWVFPVKLPPDRIAPWPVVAPIATMDTLLIELLKVWFANPLTLKSNTNSKVAGWLLLTVTTPLAASENVTLPVGLKFMFPCSRVPPLKSPLAALSRYSLTLPGTTLLCQFKDPPPVKDSCFTSTFSWAEAVRITCRLVASVRLNA
jgi:hypothetical protein